MNTYRKGIFWFVLLSSVSCLVFLFLSAQNRISEIRLSEQLRMDAIKKARTATPILHAIYRYKDINGVYPDALNELVPNFVKKRDMENWRFFVYGSEKRELWEYNKDNKGWSLSYIYVPPIVEYHHTFNTSSEWTCTLSRDHSSETLGMEHPRFDSGAFPSLQ